VLLSGALDMFYDDDIRISGSIRRAKDGSEESEASFEWLVSHERCIKDLEHMS
jgi:hypothetical protein